MNSLIGIADISQSGWVELGMASWPEYPIFWIFFAFLCFVFVSGFLFYLAKRGIFRFENPAFSLLIALLSVVCVFVLLYGIYAIEHTSETVTEVEESSPDTRNLELVAEDPEDQSLVSDGEELSTIPENEQTSSSDQVVSEEEVLQSPENEELVEDGSEQDEEVFSELEPTCADGIEHCSTQADCEEQVHYWYDEVCNVEPEPEPVPTCADAIQYCLTSTDCGDNGHYWYSDVCNAEPEPELTCADDTSFCTSREQCLALGYFWYNDQCKAESEPEPEGEETDEEVVPEPIGVEEGSVSEAVTESEGGNLTGVPVDDVEVIDTSLECESNEDCEEDHECRHNRCRTPRSDQQESNTSSSDCRPGHCTFSVCRTGAALLECRRR